MKPPKGLDLLVTLLPSFSHFQKFADDRRLAGIRLNSAMLTNFDLDRELALIPKGLRVPLYFDIKGRQLRVVEVYENPAFLDLRLNHPIKVVTPTPVLFKGGEDDALLAEVSEDGYRLKFHGGPHNFVRAGESLHIRHKSLRVGGEQFVDAELKKIEQVKKFGIERWFLSYVQSKRDVDEFLELVGKDAEVVLKIESKQGLEYVAREFKKRDNLRLCAAKGDLYVELDWPHEILKAQELIIEKDPQANAGSRMLLSVIKRVPRIEIDEHGTPSIKTEICLSDVPSDADFEQLAWLYNIGYRSFMLCDELCLRDDLLTLATNALDTFKSYYAR